MSLTRRLILQKARHHRPNAGSDGSQGHGFRYSFTPLPGYFSPFPHGTHPLSVIRKYSGLPGGPGRFTADSTSPLLLGDILTGAAMFSPTGFSPSTTDHPRPLRLTQRFFTPARAGGPKTKTPHNTTPTTPAGYHHECGLAILRVRSPLLTESHLFSFPTGTEMFHFPAFPPAGYTFTGG